MKLAVVRLSAMGDILHAYPLLHVLKKNLKENEIHLITQKKFASWAGAAPFVDGIHPVDFSSGTARKASLDGIRACHLDSILDAQGLYKSALLALRSGAALRVGFESSACREPLCAFLYHRKVKPAGGHIIEKNLSLAEEIGCADLSLDGYSLDFLPEDPALRVRDFLRTLEGRPFVLFHPFSSRGVKDFPLDPVKRLGPFLHEKNMRLVVGFGPGQEERGKAAAGALSGVPVPLLSVREMASLIAKAACVIAPDTGFLHMADGLRRPTISFFTHLPPERNGPFFGRGLVFWRESPDPVRMRSFLEKL